MAKAEIVKVKLELENGEARLSLDAKLSGIPQKGDRVSLNDEEYVVEQTYTLWQVSAETRKKSTTGERIIVVKCKAEPVKQSRPQPSRPTAVGGMPNP
jgi:hypothetical protein